MSYHFREGFAAEAECADPAPAQSPLPGGWRIFWALAAAMFAFIIARDVAQTRWSDGSIGGVALWGRDFVNVWSSGALTLQHKLAILYDVDAYRAFQTGLLGDGVKWHNYSYPPVTLLYTWVFALLPYPLALGLWLGGTGAFFAWAARPYMREAGLPAWAALAAPACLMNLWTGHYGFLVGGLWLAAFHLLPRRPVVSGALIGLMVVKPHLAILLPLVLLAWREGRAFAAAAATVAAVVALSILLFGWQSWATYLTGTARLQASMVGDVGTFFITMMPTLTPALATLGVPLAVAAVAQIVVAAGAVALLLKRLPADPHRAALATATATFLVLPYAFAYDMTVAGMAGLLLFRESLTSPHRPAWRFAAGTAALLPIAILWFGAMHWPAAPVLLAFQLAALTGVRLPAFKANSAAPA
jgi:alpha-1,2-mannosyltransferase